MKNNNYTHGYSERENQRLREQSGILKDLIHSGIKFSPDKGKILEAGCGVGAQTYWLSKNNSESDITSIDFSNKSILQAREFIEESNLKNVNFLQADINRLPFPDNYFDNIFVCFVLEHLSSPHNALIELKRVLKQDGTIVVTEGDHGSCFWHPNTENSRMVWNSFIKTQSAAGHNGLIGRGLHPLLSKAGFNVKSITPLNVYADSNESILLNEVVNKIIIPMVESSKDKTFELNLIDKQIWNSGIEELHSAGIPPEGTFFYTWFRAIAQK